MTDYLTNAGAEGQSRCRAYSSQDMKEAKTLIAAFSHRACRLVGEAASAIDAAGGIVGIAHYECFRATNAHSQYAINRLFWDALSHLRHVTKASPDVCEVLEKLFYLNAMYLVEKHAGDYLEDGYLSGQQLGWVRQHISQLLGELQPDVIALTDSWDFCDEELQSALGRKDGNVYEAYMDW